MIIAMMFVSRDHRGVFLGFLGHVARKTCLFWRKSRQAFRALLSCVWTARALQPQGSTQPFVLRKDLFHFLRRVTRLKRVLDARVNPCRTRNQ